MQGGLQQLHALRRSRSLVIEGTLRLGVIESMQPVLLPGTMRHLRERHPQLDVRPVRGRSSGLTDAVKAGTLDAAVVAQPEGGGSARLAWQPLFRRELLLIAPPSSGEASAAALFRQYDWIRYDRSTVSGAMAARWVNAHMRTKRSALELDSAAAIIAMVSAGLGVSVVQLFDPSICLGYPVRRVRLGRGAPVLQMSLVMRKDDGDRRPLAALKEAIDTALAITMRQHSSAGF